MKAAAFFRTRPSGEPVDRDFSDAAVLLDRLGAEIAETLRDAPQMLRRVVNAARRIEGDDAALAAAARELVRTRQADTIAEAELVVRRATRRFLNRAGS